MPETRLMWYDVGSGTCMGFGCARPSTRPRSYSARSVAFTRACWEARTIFLIFLPWLARARMPGDLCPHFGKPIRDNVPGGSGKNRTLQRVFPDLLSNHTTAIEKERCQANTEKHPEKRQNDKPSSHAVQHGVEELLGWRELLAFLTTVVLFPRQPLFSRLTWV